MDAAVPGSLQVLQFLAIFLFFITKLSCIKLSSQCKDSSPISRRYLRKGSSAAAQQECGGRAEGTSGKPPKLGYL